MRIFDWRLFLVTAMLIEALLAAAEPAKAEKRVALVVGNATYVHVPRLANPRNDAALIAETLKRLGFTLVGGGAQVDLDKAGFDNAVQNFGTQLQGADVGLFYFAGHGVQVRGANYLVPIGANPAREADVDFQMLDTNLVLRQMEGSGTKLNLVILDACRNNPFGGRGLRDSSRGLAQMMAPEGTLISFATQPGNVALDGADGNSPYTKALAQIMLRPGLGIFDVFNEVGLAVKTSTSGSQQPWVSSSPIAGAFYFAGAPAALTTTAPQPPASLDPAAQAWAAAKDTTNPAILEAFIRRYGDTFYGDLARARLDELKRNARLEVPKMNQTPTPTSPNQQAKAPPVVVPALIYRRWTKVCPPNDGVASVAAKQPCFIFMEGRDNAGALVVRATLMEQEGEAKKTIVVSFINGVDLMRGTHIVIDQSSLEATAPYVVCVPANTPPPLFGCVSQYEITAEVINAMKRGKYLTIQTIFNNQTLSPQLPLAEFAKAYDGPPTDLKAEAEQEAALRKALQERAKKQQ